MSRFFTYPVWIFLLFICCEEAIEVPADDSGTPKLVVEGLLTSEFKPQEITLTTSYINLNATPPPVTNAQVILHDGDTPILLSHDPEVPGVYRTPNMQVLFGKTYTLAILHEGNQYYAQASAAFGTPLPELKYFPVDSSQYEYQYEDSVNSMTEVIITWPYGADSTVTRRAFYYTLGVIEVNSVFAPDKSPLRFPPGATIFRRKYSLTDSHQEFLRSFLSEVDWRGGAFDVEAANVLTNITGGALGYFSVSVVDTDSTLVE